jgi:LCP family protein required for cell wall assembly
MAERSVRDPFAPPLRARHAGEPEPVIGRRRLDTSGGGIDRPPAAAPTDPRRGVRTGTEQARPARPPDADRLRSDRRRLVAAIGSSVVPGLGQALNGRLRPALLFVLPTLAVLGIAWLFAASDKPTMLVAKLIAPPVLGLLLLLNLVILAWRLASVVHAFLDRRYPLRPGRLGVVGLAALLVATTVPHLAAWSYGTAAEQMFGQIFGGSTVRSLSSPAPAPGVTERLNVLLIGIDSAPGRTEALTDSMIVVSLDPVGRTVTMLSIPRDLASVPLGNGNTYGPKINSLMSFAERNRKDFPKGGVRTLQDAIGALLGIPIHYYATVDLGGFVGMVDAVGGVDITVRKALDDPNYPGLDGKRGWSVEPGPHHFNGTDALAYARIRKSLGESDLTRAARQQEVLVALRNQAVSAGILFRLPSLMSAVGATVRTDLPTDRLPQLAAFAEQIGGSSTTKLVLGSPQIKAGGPSAFGSTFVPVPSRIRQLVKVVFGPPGGDPTWPVPPPSAAPSGSAARSSAP